MVSIEVIHKPTNEIRLDFFVEENNGGYFQSEAFFSVCSSCSNNNPVLLIAKENDLMIGSLLANAISTGHGLKKAFSGRALVIGGPIIAKHSQHKEFIAHKLIEGLNSSVSRRVIYIEFRNLFPLSDLHNTFIKSGYKFKDHLNYQIKLTSEGEVINRISKSRMRQIRKSLSSGATIEQANSKRDLMRFYEIIKELYSIKIKKPLPSFDFFNTIYLNSISSNDIKFFVIKYQGETIGGIVAPIFNRVIYEWYICGIDNKYKHIYPSVLATWAPIQYGLNNGLRIFDFLGAGSPEKDYGVREFKSRFGGDLSKFGRYKYIRKPIQYKIGELGLSTLALMNKA